MVGEDGPVLVITRKEYEEILIGPDVVVRVCKIKGKQVQIGVVAPKDVKVLRKELADDERGDESACHQ